MTGDEIRESFLRFFEGKGHLRIPSSSLIPAGDPTLLLTNAGMVQMKPYFTGEMTPPSRRLTTCQKCFRTTDIDSVGDSTHLTFFEMLGNFSVGDYFKKEAIQWAWEFVTEHLGLARERLWVTVYTDDDEALGHWVKTGVPPERIRHFGEEANFWGPAGSEGPCGPCSELHYDFGQEYGCRQPGCGPNCENMPEDTGRRCDRFVELWNLVFMQYYQAADGSRMPLPAPNIDTGMGLERAAAILQGRRTLYETDLLAPIVKRVAKLCGRQYGEDEVADYAMRVVAEHARSAAFLIADGVVPGNDGRGYVLRRVIRRAIRYGKKLGLEDVDSSAHGSTGSPRADSLIPAHPEPVEGRAVLPQVAGVVMERMKGQYPDLEERREFVMRVIGLEEEGFQRTFQTGYGVLQHTLLGIRKDTQEYLPIFKEDFEKVLSLQNGNAVVHRIPEAIDNYQGRIEDHIFITGGRNVVEEVLAPIVAALEELKSAATQKSIVDFVKDYPARGPWESFVGYLRDKFDQVEAAVVLISEKLMSIEVFSLYATYGFPPELTEEIAKENGLKGIDWDGFQEEMRKHAETSRGTEEKFGGDFDAVRVYQEMGIGSTTFLGYETLTAQSVIVGLLVNGEPVGQAAEGQQVEVVLRETPFYAEMGGQMGDMGEIVGQGSALRVDDTRAPIAGLTVHRCTVVQGSIALGDTVEATVDVQRRQDIARNHTATHMLHAALRRVLGTHVRQHGSLVAPDRLRFDFTHVSPLSPEELQEVQRITNDEIRENVPVESRETTYRQAVSDGALAFFGDRYGDHVRVVKVAPSTGSEQAAPFSMEVCGGTHVHRTGDIGLCHIVSESSIGSGLRRIEAVTGRGVQALLSQLSASLEEAAHRLQVPPDQLVPRVDGLLGELEQARRRAEGLERELLKHQVRELPRKQIAGIGVVSGVLSVSSADYLREAGDWLRNEMKSGVVVLGTVLEERPTLVVMATRDVVDQGFHAGNVVRDAARAMGGGGGGRPEMGQAGGRDPGRLKDALQAAEEEIKRWGERR